VNTQPGLSVENIVGLEWNWKKKMNFFVAAIFFIANYHIMSSGQINFHKNRAFSYIKNISFLNKNQQLAERFSIAQRYNNHR
jgi:hypothetical protein